MLKTEEIKDVDGRLCNKAVDDGVTYIQFLPDEFFMPIDSSLISVPFCALDLYEQIDRELPLMCPCGNKELHIIQTDKHEISGRCPKCKFQDIIYD